MSDSSATTEGQAKDILNSLAQYAPNAIAAISQTLPGTAGAQLNAAQATEPGYEQLYNQNQLATAGTEANVVEGPGGRLVNAADKYQQELDPEFYHQRSGISAALDKLLSYDPNNLSPTELAGISRGINATTGPVTPSALNTIKNAQTFGAAGQERWKNFGDAITKAAGALPGLKSGLVGFDIAKTRGANAGSTNAAQNALASNFGFSTSALGNITSGANAALAKQKDDWEKALMVSQIGANIGSSIGSAAGAGGVGSDRRLKQNIASFSDGLTTLLGLNPVSWSYNGDGGEARGVKGIGVIAQDVMKEMPYLVGGRTGTIGGKTTTVLTVNQLPVIWVLVNAVKELAAKVAELESNNVKEVV